MPIIFAIFIIGIADASFPISEWDSLNTKLASYLSVYDKPIDSLLQVRTIPDAPICGGGNLTLALDGTHRQVNYYVTKSDFWQVHSGRQVFFQRLQ